MSESTNLPAKNGKDVRTYLEANQERIAEVCAQYMTPARVIQLAALCAYKNPDIAKCDPPSVLAAVIQGASLGLDFSPSAGEAHLVPRWNKQAGVMECQFQVGYQGLTKLARESGIRYIQGRVVREGETFDWSWSPELEMKHCPGREADRGHVTHAYAVARTETGELIGECMTRGEVEVIRSRSQRPNAGPWQTDWEEMAKKTAIRRLCKSLPKTPRLIEALEASDSDFRPDDSPDGQPDAAELPPGATKTDRITALVGARANGLKNGNGSGHTPPTAPQAPGPVAQVQAPSASETVQRQAIAATVTATVEPLPPRNGEELARHAAESETLGWFEQFGESKGYPRRLKFWKPDYVKLAWAEYQNEGSEAT